MLQADAAAMPAFIGVAGGDGTVRCVVDVVVHAGGSIPVLAVPGGTRNHFAGDLDMQEVDKAVEAANHGVVRSVDVGTVNGATFVNNSSIGLYPTLVAEREDREREYPKRIANLIAAWQQLRHGHRMWVEVDGIRSRVWAVFVGNNCYGDSMQDLVSRARLDEGVLDVRIARAEGRFSRLRIAGAVLFGRVSHSPLIERNKTAQVTIETGHSVEVALDGEVISLSSPLEYRSRPDALCVLVPADSRDGQGD